MRKFIVKDNKIFCPYCESQIEKYSLELEDKNTFTHICGNHIQNPLLEDITFTLMRINEINIDFGLDDDTLQDYVDLLYKGIKNLTKEPIDKIGHEEYKKKKEWTQTDPLKTAKNRKKLFITQDEQ